VQTITPPRVLCANCGTELIGQYCHQCGQQKIDADWHSVPRFLRTFADELVHVDFKSVRSLAALFRPGYLAGEFLAGRRRQFLGPLRLYFLCAAVFFFLGPVLSGFSLEEILENDKDGMLRRIVDSHVARSGIDFALFAERFDRIFQTVYTASLAVSLIAAALVLRLLFRRTVPVLAPHLVFSIYYVAFFCLAALILGALEQATGAVHPLVSLLATFSVLVPYAYMALRRVYGDPPGSTLWKAMVLLFVGFVVDNLVNFGALYLTLFLV
jgi:hypothetical protein